MFLKPTLQKARLFLTLSLAQWILAFITLRTPDMPLWNALGYGLIWGSIVWSDKGRTAPYWRRSNLRKRLPRAWPLLFSMAIAITVVVLVSTSAIYWLVAHDWDDWVRSLGLVAAQGGFPAALFYWYQLVDFLEEKESVS